MRRKAGFALVLLLCMAPAMALAGGAVDKMMKKADDLYAQRAKKGMADQAIEAYQQVLAVDDTNAEAYWKIAKTYYWLGSRAGSSSVAAKHYREGIEFAKLGVAANEKSAGAHFWLAVSYGSFGEVKGVMQSLHLIDPMKKELERSLALDENFELGGAYRVLCRLYMKLPGFKAGDINRAIEYGRKSVKLGPNHPMNHLYLGEALLEAGQKDEAKKVLQHVVDMPALAGIEPECKEYRAQAKKLLASM